LTLRMRVVYRAPGTPISSCPRTATSSAAATQMLHVAFNQSATYKGTV